MELIAVAAPCRRMDLPTLYEEMAEEALAAGKFSHQLIVYDIYSQDGTQTILMPLRIHLFNPS